jgi:hypothetical protein
MKFQILTDYFYRNNLFKWSVNNKGTSSKSKGRPLVVRDESNFTTRSQVGVGNQEWRVLFLLLGSEHLRDTLRFFFIKNNSPERCKY